MFANKSNVNRHVKSYHDKIKHPCPRQGCTQTFTDAGAAQKHAENVHDGKRHPCPLKKKRGCKRNFSSPTNAYQHVRIVHNRERFACPDAKETGCDKRYAPNHLANMHAEKKHRNISPPKPPRNSEGVACPYAEAKNCKDLFTSTSNANNHAKNKHGNEIFDCSECKEIFADRSSVDRHKKTKHSDNEDKGTPEDHFCPRAINEGCNIIFPSKRAARDHSVKEHGTAEPDETYVMAWPRELPHVFVKDVLGEKISWKRVPKPSALGGRFICPDSECSFTGLDISEVKIHFVGKHLGGLWPCRHNEEFGCNEFFSSKAEAKYHASEHFAKYGWICQFDTCLGHIQGRRSDKSCSEQHYKRHVERKHIREGECQPEKVF